ncbi:MAG: hypothetical protein OHK0048_27010 [Rhodoferax sp.]
MPDELRQLLAYTEPHVSRADYVKAVVVENVLSKPTRKARELMLRYLRALYSLDTANPIFRALRRLWPLSETSQPMQALAVALARDPLLRTTRDVIVTQPIGAAIAPRDGRARPSASLPRPLQPGVAQVLRSKRRRHLDCGTPAPGPIGALGHAQTATAHGPLPDAGDARRLAYGRRHPPNHSGQKASAQPQIEHVHRANLGEISRHLRGTEPEHVTDDERILTADYPLLPVRRRFWERVPPTIDATVTVSQLCSHLRVVLEAVFSTTDAPLGHVVSGDFL